MSETTTCRLCGEPVHIDGEGVATHRDGLGSHAATPAGGHPASDPSVCRAAGCGEAATAPPAGQYDEALMAAFRAARDEVPATETRVVAPHAHSSAEHFPEPCAVGGHGPVWCAECMKRWPCPAATRLNERGSVDGPAVFLIGAAIFALYLVAVLVVAR